MTESVLTTPVLCRTKGQFFKSPHTTVHVRTLTDQRVTLAGFLNTNTSNSNHLPLQTPSSRPHKGPQRPKSLNKPPLKATAILSEINTRKHPSKRPKQALKTAKPCQKKCSQNSKPSPKPPNPKPLKNQFKKTPFPKPPRSSSSDPRSLRRPVSSEAKGLGLRFRGLGLWV